MCLSQRGARRLEILRRLISSWAMAESVQLSQIAYFVGTISLNNPNSLSEEDITQINALYDGTVAAFDHEVGSILRYLKENKLADKTILIISADHGENIYEKDYGMGHGEHPILDSVAAEVPVGGGPHRGSSRTIRDFPRYLEKRR